MPPVPAHRMSQDDTSAITLLQQLLTWMEEQSDIERIGYDVADDLVEASHSDRINGRFFQRLARAHTSLIEHREIILSQLQYVAAQTPSLPLLTESSRALHLLRRAALTEFEGRWRAFAVLIMDIEDLLDNGLEKTPRTFEEHEEDIVEVRSKLHCAWASLSALYGKPARSDMQAPHTLGNQRQNAARLERSTGEGSHDWASHRRDRTSSGHGIGGTLHSLRPPPPAVLPGQTWE